MDTNTMTRARAIEDTERCDRCGNRAYVLAQKDEFKIAFCNHHGNENIPRLTVGGWNIIQDQVEE